MRGMFLIVMTMHTPFIGFIAKESLLCLAWIVNDRFVQRQQIVNGKHKYDKIFDENNEGVHNQNTTINEGLVQNQPRNSIEKSEDFTKQGLVHPSNNDESLNVDDRLKPLDSVHSAISDAILSHHSHGESSDATIISDIDAKNVEDILPNWIYYSVTITMFVGTVIVS